MNINNKVVFIINFSTLLFSAFVRPFIRSFVRLFIIFFFFQFNYYFWLFVWFHWFVSSFCLFFYWILFVLFRFVPSIISLLILNYTNVYAIHRYKTRKKCDTCKHTHTKNSEMRREEKNMLLLGLEASTIPIFPKQMYSKEGRKWTEGNTYWWTEKTKQQWSWWSEWVSVCVQLFNTYKMLTFISVLLTACAMG